MKDVLWLGSSKDDLTVFPDAARRMAATSLGLCRPGLFRRTGSPWHRLAPACANCASVDVTGTFRVMYLAARPEGVYVLHAFQKETQKTSLHDLRLAQERLKLIPR